MVQTTTKGVTRARLPTEVRPRRRVIRLWLSDRVEHLILIVIVTSHLTLFGVILSTPLGLYSGRYDPDALLSAIAQATGAILALLVTLTLVATQLASEHYTPRMVSQRLRDAWFWGAVVVYLACILFALIVESARGWGPIFWEQDAVSIALLLAGAALLYMVPFIIATLKSLQPERVAEMLIAHRDYDALDEMLRGAINDGKLTISVRAINIYTAHVRMEMARATGSAETALKLAALFRQVGRHAWHRNSSDAVELLILRLGELAAYCDEHPRLWRAAADVFNEALEELYSYYKGE